MEFGNSQIIRVSTGKLNTVNDTVIGGVPMGTGTDSAVRGQLGKRLWLDPDTITGMYSTAVGTLFGGSYRYVRMRDADDDSPAVQVGQILFWDKTVANWQKAYQVTRSESLGSPDGAVHIAGIYLGGFTGGNYGFIQDGGMVNVLFRAQLTAAGALDSRVYAAGAGAGVDEGLADVLTNDALSLANARFLGIAAGTAPAASTLSPINLMFHNILG